MSLSAERSIAPRRIDIVVALETAANTIDAVPPFDRRKLIEEGVAVVASERTLLILKGNVLPMEPGFMSDMPTLAEMAGHDDALELIVSAGMLMLAGEIARLRNLHNDQD